MARVLSPLETDALLHSMVDEDAAGDIAFFLYATITYCIVRLATEVALPGKIRGYTHQQYVVTLGHQAVLLPCIGVGWWFGYFDREGSSLIYLLTGAYMISDSIVNYSPVSGCVAAFRDSEKPTFSYSVHIHHVFTVALCALGTTLPSWLEDEGAVCVLIGEAGSLWITVTLLWPTALNYILRFYTFLASRALGVLLALDIARQLTHPLPRVLLLAMGIGIAHDKCVRPRAREGRGGGGSRRPLPRRRPHARVSRVRAAAGRPWARCARTPRPPMRPSRPAAPSARGRCRRRVSAWRVARRRMDGQVGALGGRRRGGGA
jgi:hypothetical protein